jgi:hypothetical protein
VGPPMMNKCRSRMLATLFIVLAGTANGESEKANAARPVFPWAGQDAALDWPPELIPEYPAKLAKEGKPDDPYKSQDLTGVWRGPIRHGNPEYPMTPAGQAVFDSRQKDDRRGDHTNLAAVEDPLQDCNPAGMPRILDNDGGAAEFVHTNGRILHFIERAHIWRDIWMDGRTLPEDPDPRWLGYSVGRWDGETLVVETTGVDDRSWLDLFGKPQSTSAHIEERWQRVNFNTLQLNIMVTDPEMYEEALSLEPRVFWRQPHGELREVFCAPVDVRQFYEKLENKARDSGS